MCTYCNSWCVFISMCVFVCVSVWWLCELLAAKWTTVPGSVPSLFPQEGNKHVLRLREGAVLCQCLVSPLCVCFLEIWGEIFFLVWHVCSATRILFFIVTENVHWYLFFQGQGSTFLSFIHWLPTDCYDLFIIGSCRLCFHWAGDA